MVHCRIGGCGQETSFPKRHLIEVHLPDIFDERYIVTDDLSRTRYSCLAIPVKCMMGPKASLQDVCDRLNRYSMITPGWEITDRQREVMEALCRVQNWEVPRSFSLSPVKSPAALTHWRCLRIFADQIAWATMEETRGQYAVPIPQSDQGCVTLAEGVSAESAGDPPAPEDEEGMVEGAEAFQQVMCAFDSHFHLDRTRHRLKLGDAASVQDIEEAMPTMSKEYLVRVTGGVAVPEFSAIPSPTLLWRRSGS